MRKNDDYSVMHHAGLGWGYVGRGREGIHYIQCIYLPVKNPHETFLMFIIKFIFSL